MVLPVVWRARGAIDVDGATMSVLHKCKIYVYRQALGCMISVALIINNATKCLRTGHVHEYV